MATDRTTENHITATINEKRRRATYWLYRFGIPVVVIVSVIWPAGIPIWVLIWIICFRATRFTASSILLTGAAGEDRALAVLSGLPTEYILFNQIRLPDERSKTGFREADFVVVGPNGVFIIENKDFRGWIQGDGNSSNWEVHKVGRGGTPYIKSCRNPVRQVQTWA